MTEKNTEMNKMLEAEISLRKELTEKLPADVLKQLEGAYSDAECCKILAENGVDLDEIEKTIADHGFDMHKLGLQLPETELEGVSGGFKDSDYDGDVKCPWCGTSSRKDFSRQQWRSLFSTMKSYYRCEKCNLYFGIDKSKQIWKYGTKKEFDEYYYNKYWRD
jgi:hypothetical protein